MNVGRAILDAWWVGCALACACCSRSQAATVATDPSHGVGAAGPPATAGAPCSGHVACADSFVVDALAPEACTAGSVCTLSWKLVAGGEFHINDEYPYRFKADAAAGIEFVGQDPAGKNVFSKSAGDWQKTDAKVAVMTVRFTPEDRGEKTISGVLKLSVCSAETCVLEQRHISASLRVQ